MTQHTIPPKGFLLPKNAFLKYARKCKNNISSMRRINGSEFCKQIFSFKHLKS